MRTAFSENDTKLILFKISIVAQITIIVSINSPDTADYLRDSSTG